MSDNTETIHISLSQRSYDIVIGSGILDQSASYLQQRRDATHAVVITDTNVEPHHGTAVEQALEQAGLKVDSLVIEAGEPSKSIETTIQIWEQLLQLGADRKTVIVPVGGGVVGDLAGFIAATYRRGLPFMQVPTSLLAQVDSSVGGKTGINLPQAKNMVGAFLQPLGVLIDTKTLDTLPEREYKAGLGEVVKYGVILDADFFAFLEQNVEAINNRDHDVLRHVIARCCRLKADVVEEDEFETTGVRAILNYGHTFGHAIEAVSGYGVVLHGEGVSIGMLCASRLAVELGLADPSILHRQRALLDGLGLRSVTPDDADRDQLMEAMQHDKKVEHGKLRFVLPREIGRVEVRSDVPTEPAMRAFE